MPAKTAIIAGDSARGRYAKTVLERTREDATCLGYTAAKTGGLLLDSDVHLSIENDAARVHGEKTME